MSVRNSEALSPLSSMKALYVIVLILVLSSSVHAQTAEQHLAKYTQDLQLGLSGNDATMVITAIDGMRTLGVTDPRLDFFEGRARIQAMNDVRRGQLLLQRYVKDNPVGQYAGEANALIVEAEPAFQKEMNVKYNQARSAYQNQNDPIKTEKARQAMFEAADAGGVWPMADLGVNLLLGMKMMDMDETRAWQYLDGVVAEEEKTAWESPYLGGGQKIWLLTYLGRAHHYGWGVPQDYGKAHDYYQRAGEIGAELNIGKDNATRKLLYGAIAEMYAFGEGVPRDCDTARSYLTSGGTVTARMLFQQPCHKNIHDDYLMSDRGGPLSPYQKAVLMEQGHFDDENAYWYQLMRNYRKAYQYEQPRGKFREYDSDRMLPVRRQEAGRAALRLAEMGIEGMEYVQQPVNETRLVVDRKDVPGYLEFAVEHGIDEAGPLLEQERSYWDNARQRADLMAEIARYEYVFGLKFADNRRHEYAVSVDGRYAAVSSGANVRVWESASKEMVAELDDNDTPVTGLAFSPDGRYLAAKSEKDKIILWDTQKWKRRGRMRVDDYGSTLAFSPDSRLLLAGQWSSNRGMIALSTPKLKAVWTSQLNGAPDRFETTEDGKNLLVTTSQDTQILDYNTGRLIWQSASTYSSSGRSSWWNAGDDEVLVLTGGEYLYRVSQSRKLLIWSGEHDAFDLSYPSYSSRFGPGGRWIVSLVDGWKDQNPRLIISDPHTGLVASQTELEDDEEHESLESFWDGHYLTVHYMGSNFTPSKSLEVYRLRFPDSVAELDVPEAARAVDTDPAVPETGDTECTTMVNGVPITLTPEQCAAVHGTEAKPANTRGAAQPVAPVAEDEKMVIAPGVTVQMNDCTVTVQGKKIALPPERCKGR